MSKNALHTRLFLIIIMMATLTACGAGKAVVDSEEETHGLTKAEIDTIQYDAARLAMESGEFVFMISRASFSGRIVYTTPKTNYFEVTNGKWFLQKHRNPKKNAERTAGRVMESKFECDSSMCILSMQLHEPFASDLTDAVLTLYPGSNKASGVLSGGCGMKIEGVILPRKVANIARIAPPSFAEERDAW